MKSIIPIILCLVFFLSKGWVLEAQPKAAYCPIPNRSVGKIKVTFPDFSRHFFTL